MKNIIGNIIENIIETTNLTFNYKRRLEAAFKIRKFKLKKGEKILLTGPSGIGKTTFMFLLSNFYNPHDGDVFYDGKNIKDFKESELADYKKKHFGFIIPKYSLIPHFTVEENLRLAHFSRHFTKNDLIDVLQKVGIHQKTENKIHTLSQGEEQRVGIAKLLLLKPKVIFADEPTSNLDDKNTTRVLQLIEDELDDSTILMCSHDRRTHEFFREKISFEDMLIS